MNTITNITKNICRFSEEVFYFECLKHLKKIENYYEKLAKKKREEYNSLLKELNKKKK